MASRSVTVRFYALPRHGFPTYVVRRYGAGSERPVSPVRAALEQSASSLVGVGRLASMMPNAHLPLPKPFGVHIVHGTKVHPTLVGCTIDRRLDHVTPDSDAEMHCAYAVQYEFPWFPLIAGLVTEPSIKESIAEIIEKLVSRNESVMARRWWFAYELFFESLPIEDMTTAACIPFLPPERFFCTAGDASPRHGVLDNLLGGRDFCPFVEKFALAAAASSNLQQELHEVLSPICIMSVKALVRDLGLKPESQMDQHNFELVAQQLEQDGFGLNTEEQALLVKVFQVESCPLISTSLAELAKWLRGGHPLASRLREHLLGVSATDLRWQPAGDQFLDRLSRVVSSVETRASEMIEDKEPPQKKQRFFVDLLSKPWERGQVTIDAAFTMYLQQGLLSAERYEKVCKTQVGGEPRRDNQNWVSSEAHDEMTGKEKLLHHLPPPPESLPALLDGYFKCVQRMIRDPTMDPIVCATIAKIAYNTLHPLVDGNGRVQRFLFQLILFEFGFLPRMNVPLVIAMLQDRTGYEVLQQKHVDQIMAGISYTQKMTDEGDTYQHLDPNTTIESLYRFQDFTFASSSMIKLLQSTLPVLAGKSYFLQRFDWRVDELLKGDAVLSPKAATRLAKVFKNDGAGVNLFKLCSFFFADGWKLGLTRLTRFLEVAKHPGEDMPWQSLKKRNADRSARAKHQDWIRQSGQHAAASSTGRVRWVGISLDRFEQSAVALKRALVVSRPGDTVMAVHYPPHPTIGMDFFPGLAGEEHININRVRDEILLRSKGVLESCKPDGIEFRVFVGLSSVSKPAYQLCEDARVADVPPYRIYVGYSAIEERNAFTDWIVRAAPCDVVIVKGEGVSAGTTRWVGISTKRFDKSAAALTKAFHHSKPGDTVIAVHYPMTDLEEVGSSLVTYDHLASWSRDELDFMDNELSRMYDSLEKIAQEHHTDGGIDFKIICRDPTMLAHEQLIHDARKKGPEKPHSIYVGYDFRHDRDRLVEPNKLHDVAEYVVKNASCNVVVVKETEAEMKSRIRSRKQRWGT